MAENRSYMQRFAMLFGTYMGVFWVLKFILFPIGLTTPFLLFLFVGLTLCVPFMGFHYARQYRNEVCGGSMGFVQAWMFTLFMYMFAALLTSVAHYIYFRFIDNGYIIDFCDNQIDIVAQSNIPGMDGYINTYRENIAAVRQLSPIEITLQLVSTNVFIGTLLAFPTALFVMKRKKEEQPTNQ